MKMFFRLLTFAIILTFVIMSFCSCGIDLDPCTLEVGDELKGTAFEGGLIKYVEFTISGCDTPVILEIIGDPVFRRPGDVTKYRVVKVNSPHSYDVKVIE